MDYKKIYNSLTSSERCSGRVKTDKMYFESHHIIPTCVGGNDNESNKVLLTAREHYIAHALLTFIYGNETEEYHKLLWAFNGMRAWKTSDQKRHYKCNSYLYESLKGKYKHSELTKQSISNSLKGHIVSDTTKEKMSITRKRKLESGEISSLVGEKNGMYGKQHSKETIELYSLQRKGKSLNLSEEQIQKKSERVKGEKNPMFGQTHTAKARKKMSEASKGRIDTPETTEKRRKASANKIHIHKGNDGKFVYPEVFENELKSLGWELGMRPRKKK